MLQVFAQTPELYDMSADMYGTQPYSQPNPLMTVLWFAIIVVIVVSQIKLFTKAGRAWWKALIPFYNIYVWLQIVGRPGWWLILYFIPLVNIVIMIIVAFDAAKAYGKSWLYALGILLLPMVTYPILAFGNAQYVLGGGGNAPMAPSAPTTPEAQAPQQPQGQPQGGENQGGNQPA